MSFLPIINVHAYGSAQIFLVENDKLTVASHGMSVDEYIGFSKKLTTIISDVARIAMKSQIRLIQMDP